MKNLTCFILLVSLTCLGQRPTDTKNTHNIFLDNNFWKSNPPIELIKQKITKGNDITAFDKYKFDPVVKAILAEVPVQTIQFLLTFEGNNVHKITHDKRTYLHWAAIRNNSETVAYLLKKGASVSHKDSHQFTPLTFATNAPSINTQIFDLLVANGADFANDTNGHGANVLLLSAGKIKNAATLKYFTAKGIAINSIDEDGNNLLHYAAKSGNTELIELLLQKGFSIDVKKNLGENVVLTASHGSRGKYNSLDFFKFLVSKGAKANLTNTNGVNAFHNLAKGNKNTALFDYFKSQKSNPLAKDNLGNTPFLNATAANTTETLQWFVKNGANVNNTNLKGQFPLANAMGNNLDAIQYLIAEKAKVNAKDGKGNNALWYLFNSYNPRRSKEPLQDKLAILVSNKFDITTQQANGDNLYHLAAFKNSLSLLKSLHSYPVDINQKNNDGLTPLHIAVMKANDTQTITYLISIGADKSVKTDFEETVLDLAKENEQLGNYNF